VPAVATDVGDARLIIGSAGRIVPPRDPGALADALCALAALGPEERARLGAKGRARMQADFSIAAITRRYQSLYAEVLAGQVAAN